MTKSELKTMIREMLREELSKDNYIAESVNVEDDILAIDGFGYAITNTFEDDGHTGWNVIYTWQGKDIVEIETWDDGNYVTVVDELWAPNLFDRTYETFASFADDLEYKVNRYVA